MTPINEQNLATIARVAKSNGLTTEEAIDQAVGLWLTLAGHGLIGRQITLTHHRTTDETNSFGRRFWQKLTVQGVPVEGVQGQIRLPSGAETDRTLQASFTPFRNS